MAGFETDEPGFYFLVASGWRLADEDGPFAATITKELQPDTLETTYDIRLTFRPDYSVAAALVVSLREHDPDALFFPLPVSVRDVRFFLPEAIGDIAAESIPFDGYGTSAAVYYRLRFTDSQLNVLQTLARGGVALQGVVTYDFAGDAGTQTTTAPILAQLPRSAFDSLSSAPTGGDHSTWLEELLVNAELDVRHVLDRRYSLGGGIEIAVRDSAIRGRVTPGTYRLLLDSPRIRLVSAGLANFRGSIGLVLSELNLTLLCEYDALLDVTLDVSTMNVTIDSLGIQNVMVSGINAPLYAAVIRNVVNRREVLSAIADGLSSELRRMVLSQTLFEPETVL